MADRQARFKNRKVLSRRRHDDTLVLDYGQNGDWTPHDLRRTGATMMQALGISLDVIDRCQNHVLARGWDATTCTTTMPKKEVCLEPIGRSTRHHRTFKLVSVTTSKQ